MLADMVEELGHPVVAEAGNIEVGQALAETAIFDLAILDINIAGRIRDNKFDPLKLSRVGRRVIMCLQRINRHWNQADG